MKRHLVRLLVTAGLSSMLVGTASALSPVMPKTFEDFDVNKDQYLSLDEYVVSQEFKREQRLYSEFRRFFITMAGKPDLALIPAKLEEFVAKAPYDTDVSKALFEKYAVLDGDADSLSASDYVSMRLSEDYSQGTMRWRFVFLDKDQDFKLSKAELKGHFAKPPRKAPKGKGGYNSKLPALTDNQKAILLSLKNVIRAELEKANLEAIAEKAQNDSGEFAGESLGELDAQIGMLMAKIKAEMTKFDAAKNPEDLKALLVHQEGKIVVMQDYLSRSKKNNNESRIQMFERKLKQVEMAVEMLKAELANN